MNAIEINNLTKEYGELKAVSNLNLKIKKGELFSLLGLNGAGKTTTIKMLSCLIKPTSGDALILGHSINTDSQKVKEIINVSPQETAVASNLSVKENLELIAELYGFNETKAKKKTIEMLEIFNLTDKKDVKAKKLSGGTQRRLSIAMALITEPEIIFLDEPTLGLDVRARRDLWKVIEKLKEKITIILTTHYMEEAEALSDHIAIINNGELCAYGTTNELIEKTKAKNLEEAFLNLTEEEIWEF